MLEGGERGGEAERRLLQERGQLPRQLSRRPERRRVPGIGGLRGVVDQPGDTPARMLLERRREERLPDEPQLLLVGRYQDDQRWREFLVNSLQLLARRARAAGAPLQVAEAGYLVDKTPVQDRACDRDEDRLLEHARNAPLSHPLQQDSEEVASEHCARAECDDDRNARERAFASRPHLRRETIGCMPSPHSPVYSPVGGARAVTALTGIVTARRRCPDAARSVGTRERRGSASGGKGGRWGGLLGARIGGTRATSAA